MKFKQAIAIKWKLRIQAHFSNNVGCCRLCVQTMLACLIFAKLNIVTHHFEIYRVMCNTCVIFYPLIECVAMFWSPLCLQLARTFPMFAATHIKL